GAWKVVDGLDIDDFARRRIDRSVAELVDEREAVRSLGLIA
ncbi:MAG TPA: malate dehydrogenase, partial [Agromyces sp.]|nr:malate dehydrogenase [Agromyces sp.]